MHRFVKILMVWSLLCSFLAAQETASTSVPNLVRYTGTLKAVEGSSPVQPGTVGVTFAIYKEQDGGAPVWQETQNVAVDANGQYSVLLGSSAAAGLPDDLFSQKEERWLGVQVQGQSEQARVMLVSVPYAFKAHEADTLGGLPASAFVHVPGDAATASGTGPANTTAAASATTGTGTNTGSAAKQSGKPLTPAQTAKVIPVFNGTTDVDSALFQDAVGAGASVVNDSVNFNLPSASRSYQIGGSPVVSIFGVENLLLGAGAGATNSGQDNTFAGFLAGSGNSSASRNTAVGSEAGQHKLTGDGNAFTGYRAGYRNQTGNRQ